MTTRIAINGFGRIGRNVLRALLDRGADVDVVAVNDLTSPATLAQLLRYDSTLGRLGRPVSSGDDHLVVDGHRIAVLAERDPAALPWADLGVEVVLESTGRFTSAEAFRSGYDKDEVDALCRRLIAYFDKGQPITSSDIRSAAFRRRRGSAAYAEASVDAFLSRAAEVLLGVE